MCGINGVVRLEGSAPPVDRNELLCTRDAMAHRGPDGEGLWLDPARDVGLGHRRLAVIDLSDAGLQPMHSREESLVVVYNGEIYNYRELRRELVEEGAEFRTQTDTEVLLHLYEQGPEKMLQSLRGMFAFALWDRRRRRLLLARDPYGIKPLYYSVHRGVLRFASSVKALEEGGGLPLDVDPAGLTGFLLWGSVPEPFTWRRAIRALPPGSWIEVREGRVSAPQSYLEFGRCPAPEVDGLSAALDESVKAHLVSDVPIGIFLSAGLDSALIAAGVRRQVAAPPTTLTLGFDEFCGTERDEVPLAAEVAATLGTRHVERRFSRREFLELWPEIIAAMDQPSIDGFNTYLVSRVASEEGIKVVLSGLGGDELFGGYPSFRDVPRWTRVAGWLGRLPLPRAVWARGAGLVRPRSPKLRAFVELGGDLAGAYFLRRGLFLPEELPALLGEELASQGLATYEPLTSLADELTRCHPKLSRNGDVDPWEIVHLLESKQYLRNQLLRDSDWASMAHSVELRVPLVDAWLREQVARLGYEPARSYGRAAVVRAQAPELPQALWRRRKSGFTVPLAEWLDGGDSGGSRAGLGSRALALRVARAFGLEIG